MEYRILGKTGLRISRIGFGGIPIQRIDAEGTKKLIHYLHAAGVNYIDTARSYTVSEEYLGYALEGIRQDFVLATKSPASTKENMAKDIPLGRCCTGADIAFAVETLICEEASFVTGEVFNLTGGVYVG